MHQLEAWIQQKLKEPAASVREARTATYELNKHLGPRYTYARVTISVRPAEVFSLKMPSSPLEDEYRTAIENAIYAIILGSLRPILRVAIEVTEAKSHPVDSSYEAFRRATTEAFTEVLYPEPANRNIVWPWEKS